MLWRKLTSQSTRTHNSRWRLRRLCWWSGHLRVMPLKYRRVIELELWSRPSSNLPPEIGKLVIGPRCTSDLKLPEGVVLGLSEIPDPAHSTSLGMTLAEGELSRQEFDEFCARNGFEANVSSINSAARFLEYAYGRGLAWVHLPATEEGIAMGQRINAWAHSEGYCLVEPYSHCFLKGASLEHLLPPDA